MIRVTSTYDARGLVAYVPKLRDTAEHAPEEAAEFCAQRWREGVAVDTGAYQAGIYVSTHDYTGYDAAVGRAQAARPDLVPNAPVPVPARKGAARVGSVVPYDQFQEFGTRGAPAHPAFVPAVEATRRHFPELARRRLAK